MQLVPLTQGKFAQIDDSDADIVLAHKWFAVWDGWNWYAARKHRGKQQRLHNFLLNPPAGVIVDHWDGNGLNNQRQNLRLSTGSQNIHRMRAKQPHTSKFKGVSWRKSHSKWVAQIHGNGQVVYLGLFEDEQEAAQVYDSAAVRFFGENALTNRDLGLL